MTEPQSCIAPPDFAIRAAVEAGRRSPCAKSKRGAVVFKVSALGTTQLAGSGHNVQPAPFVCTGDRRCREACARLCEHAEQRAIRAAVALFGERTLAGYGLELVHAKVIDGALVAGGGPSCWQCSRELLAVGLDAAWLYEEAGRRCSCGLAAAGEPGHAPGCMMSPLDKGGEWRPNRWRRYTAEEFHRATLSACGIGVAP